MSESSRENIVFRYPKDSTESEQGDIRKSAAEFVRRLDIEDHPKFAEEINKEAWQEEIITRVDSEIARYLRDELDINVESIDSRSVHVVSQKAFNLICERTSEEPFSGETIGGHVFLSSELCQGDLAKLNFTNVLIHELLHRQAFKKFASNDHTRTPYGSVMNERRGMDIQKRSYPFISHFRGIDEGLTEILKKKILYDIVIHNPAYQEALDIRFSEMDKKIGRERFISEHVYEAFDISDVNIEQTDDGVAPGIYISRAYHDEQRLIVFIANQIRKSHPEAFSNVGEVYKVFFRAQYRGELLPMAKLIDEQFGAGTFRLLGAVPAKSNQDGRNNVARNALAFLRTPPDKRKLENAQQYIFGTLRYDDYRKYVARQNKGKSAEPESNS